MNRPLLGCIADDFTGASDLASNLVESGLVVVQCLGVPNSFDAIAGADAVVIALKTRSCHRDEAVRQSLSALESLQAMGARRFYFKYCSTFYSIDEANAVACHQLEFGREVAAAAIESTFAAIASRLVKECGVRRMIVAGGETSGAVVSSLGVRALRIGPRIATGVPWTESIDESPMAFALKSGNFGPPDFFQKAIDMLK